MQQHSSNHSNCAATSTVVVVIRGDPDAGCKGFVGCHHYKLHQARFYAGVEALHYRSSLGMFGKPQAWDMNVDGFESCCQLSILYH